MKFKTIIHNDINTLMEKVNNFLSTPGVTVISKEHQMAVNKDVFCHAIYIYYETPEESTYSRSLQTAQEKIRLSDLITQARKVMNDKKYFELKNQAQREQYLLCMYGIGRQDAQSVIEILKPEMDAVLNWWQ